MAEYVLVTPMSGTAAIIAADLLVAAHVAFILFVVFGGLTVLRWPRLAWLHLPAAVWGAVVEFNIPVIKNLDLSLAVRYDTTVQALMVANNLSSPNLIYVGQTLSVP